MRCVLVPGGTAQRQRIAVIHEISATAAYAHIFSDPFPRDEAAERWRAYDGELLLATLNGLAVGFAAWSEPVLDALYVLPEHAGGGIGTQLHQALPRTVTSLWVLDENVRGRQFYEDHGWYDTGVVRPAYEPVDEVLYRR